MVVLFFTGLWRFSRLGGGEKQRGSWSVTRGGGERVPDPREEGGIYMNGLAPSLALVWVSWAVSVGS